MNRLYVQRSVYGVEYKHVIVSAIVPKVSSKCRIQYVIVAMYRLCAIVFVYG